MVDVGVVKPHIEVAVVSEECFELMSEFTGTLIHIQSFWNELVGIGKRKKNKLGLKNNSNIQFFRYTQRTT